MKRELGKMMVMESIQKTQLVEEKKSHVSLILMLIFIGLVARAAQGQPPAVETSSGGVELSTLDADQDRWIDQTRDDDDVQDRTRAPEPEYYTVLDPL